MTRFSERHPSTQYVPYDWNLTWSINDPPRVQGPYYPPKRVTPPPLVDTTPARTEWSVTVVVVVLGLCWFAAWLDAAWAAIWFLGWGIFALTIRTPEDLIDTERSNGYDDLTSVRILRPGGRKED